MPQTVSARRSTARDDDVVTSGRTGTSGQRVLATGFLTAALSAPGQTFFVALYVPDIADAFDLTPVDISTLYGVATLLGAAALPFLGIWVDRWSAARFLSVVVAGLGLSMLALAQAGGAVALGAAWTVSRCLGQGAIGVGLLSALSHAFTANRGRALAIGTLGHPFGELVFPSAIVMLIAATSWRGSLVVFAVLYLAFFAPLVALGLRPVPRQTHAEPRPGNAASAADVEVHQLGNALRHWTLWRATLVLTAAPVVVTALLFHQVALFEDVGLSRAHVPAALIYFAAAQVGATILTGAMIDAGALRVSLSLSCAALAGAVAAMSLPVPDAVRVGTYGVALGYATGAAGVVNGALWPAYFGLGALGRIRALTSGIRNAATAGAPLLLALVAQWSDIAAARLTLGTVGIVALFVAAGLPPPPRPPEPAESLGQI